MSTTLKGNSLKTTERNASLDVLRVLAMFMIVIGHCLGHGGVDEALAGELSVNFFLSQFIMAFVSVHVNCFVLISGYFLCMSKFNLNKWLILWLSAFFWSVTLYVVTTVFCGESFAFSIKGLIKALMPFTQQGYWFVTTYLLMYLLSPVCNFAISAMNKLQHLTSILVFFAVFIVLQNLVYWREFTTINQRSPIFFIFLYFVAAYFRIYPPKKKRPWILGYILSLSFVFLWKFFVPIIIKKLFGYIIGAYMFSPYNSIFVVIGSICLFMTFAQIEIRGLLARLAIMLSPLTFGIYLIHDNNQIRTLIWQILIKPFKYAQSPFLIFIIFGVSLAIFIICACIEKVRLFIFKILHIDKICDFATKHISAVFNYIIEKASLI